MTQKRKILITAYAVNPYKGSEDGTGWNISYELAKLNHVTVVTRKNNRPEIERYFKENAGDPTLQDLNFMYYDLPKWLVFWKKKIGERGYVLYFYLWQLFMPLFIKTKGVRFDIAHALNFHSDSQPQFLWMLGKPVFWGPIGHHAPVPKEFILKNHSRKDYLKDRLYNTVKWMFRNLDPFFYISKWTAKKIFVINSAINDSVKANPNKIKIIPAVATEEQPFIRPSFQSDFNLISVGRFTYMKGFDVVIDAFANFYSELNETEQKRVKLKLVGKGEELENYQQMIKNHGLSDAIEIIKWVPKNEMPALYAASSLFVFGSHEGAGMVVPEALSFGLPIVCFDNNGPGELCSWDNALKIKYQSYDDSVYQFSKSISTLYKNHSLRENMSANARHYSKSRFSWANKAAQINEAYDAYELTKVKSHNLQKTTP